MTDLIKRKDALAACDIAPPDEWNDYTKGGYDFAAEECKRNIATLPAINPTDRIEELVKDQKQNGEDYCALMEKHDALHVKLTKAEEERDELGRKLNTARYGQPDFAWSIHEEAMADLRAKLAKAVEALRFYAPQTVGGITFLGGDDAGKRAAAMLAELGVTV